jgi:hypothetical protein
VAQAVDTSAACFLFDGVWRMFSFFLLFDFCQTPALERALRLPFTKKNGHEACILFDIPSMPVSYRHRQVFG